MAVIEIAADTVLSALAAQEGGADRVELCSALREGGLTPSLGLLRAVRSQVQLELCVLLRPRPGDFLYAPEEFAVLLEDLKIAKEEGADGVVFGVLTADGLIDEERTQHLVAHAVSVKTTFHRAIDLTRDPVEALAAAARCGVDRVLSSGGAASALEGSSRLQQMVSLAGDKVQVVVGGGVRPANIAELRTRTRAEEFHSSMPHRVSSGMRFQVPHLSLGVGATEEYSHRVVRAAEVRALVEASQSKAIK